MVAHGGSFESCGGSKGASSGLRVANGGRRCCLWQDNIFLTWIAMAKYSMKDGLDLVLRYGLLFYWWVGKMRVEKEGGR